MSKDEAMEVEEVKSRGLPEDVTENIRIVEMKGEKLSLFNTIKCFESTHRVV